MRQLLDLTGRTFDRLTVLGRAINSPSGRPRWSTKCLCGTLRIVHGADLRTGNTRSCGCLQVELTSARSRTHGLRNSLTYSSWVNMKARCLTPSSSTFHKYGAAGITVCDRWLNSFSDFFADMGERPSARGSIERIDSTGNYTPENCRWAVAVEKNRRRRNNRLIEYQGRTQCLAAWCEEIGLAQATAYNRLSRLGWSVPEAFETPVGVKRRR